MEQNDWNTYSTKYELNGVQFKSKGEYDIAEVLEKYSFPWRYEPPVAVKDGDKTKIWHPDFYTGYGIYIEFFGMNGDPSYDKLTQHKLKVYEKNSLPVIPIYNSDLDEGAENAVMPLIYRMLNRREQNYINRIYNVAGNDGIGALSKIDLDLDTIVENLSLHLR